MLRKRSLLEIFGLRLLEKEETLDLSKVLEENLVLYSQFPHNRHEHLIYDISFEKDMQINAEGQLILHGPDRGIEVGLHVAMYPCLHSLWDIKSSKIVWSNSEMPDCFRTGCIESKHAFILVDFAVYSDGLEAMFDISISDLNLSEIPRMGTSLEVYGTVRTSNSVITHPQAESILFDYSNSSNSAVFAIPIGEPEIPLPLSRRVTVIPKESDLIINVSLFVKCSSQDISIANGSVLFQAGSRSSAAVEEQIVRGSHGKVKVKVTWMEAMKDVVSAREEEEEMVDEIEPESGGEDIDSGKKDDAVSAKEEEEETVEEIEPESEGEEIDSGEEDAESECISDDGRSYGSVKLPRSENQKDISARAFHNSMPETTETDSRGQVANLVSNTHKRSKRSLLEVFSVKVINSERFSFDDIYGSIMIDTCTVPHFIFRRVRGDPLKFDPQGSAILEGPKGFAQRVVDEVLIFPFLFRYQNFDFMDEEIHGEYLWHDEEYDKLLCKRVNDDVGCIEVNFAVYEDGVEAHLDVMLTNCSFSSFQFSGTMIVSNSMLQDPGARSVVSIKESCEDLDGNAGSMKDIAVSLSRPIIAVPFGSTLKLVFNICSRDYSIDGLPFEFPVSLTGVFEQTLPGNGCSVRVKVSFFCKPPIQHVDHEGCY